MKKCNKCGIEKELTANNFTPRVYESGLTGFRGVCKECVAIANKKRRSDNKSDHQKQKEEITTKQNNLFKDGLRLCTSCSEIKTVNSFRKNSTYTHGVTHQCKDCLRGYNRENKRSWNIKNIYGLSLERYDEMIIEQDSKCKLCDTDFSNMKTQPHIDHCHSSNQVRGLLCSNCNTALGLFKDNTDTLRKAIKYLT